MPLLAAFWSFQNRAMTMPIRMANTGPPTTSKPLPQQPGGHGDHQADQDAQGVLSDKFHDTIPFSL